MVSEACCNRDRTQAVFPDPVIPAIMEVKGCSKRNRWHFCENGTVWNGVRPTLWCLDITCLCMLSFLLNDFSQTEQNQLMSAPQEQNVDWENGSIMRIDIVLKAINFNSFPPPPHISIVFPPPPPPPPQFHCFPSTTPTTTTATTILLFSLHNHHRHHNSIVFPPPPPPPPQFYCFPPPPEQCRKSVLLICCIVWPRPKIFFSGLPADNYYEINALFPSLVVTCSY